MKRSCSLPSMPRRLIETQISSAYSKRLAAGWVLVLTFLALVDIAPDDLASPDLAGAVLNGFVQQGYGKKQTYESDLHGALASQRRYKQLKNRLPLTWDALKGWKAEVPSGVNIPMPKVVVQALFVAAINKALVTDVRNARYWAPLAVLLVWGHVCLVRPGDIY